MTSAVTSYNSFVWGGFIACGVIRLYDYNASVYGGGATVACNRIWALLYLFTCCAPLDKVVTITRYFMYSQCTGLAIALVMRDIVALSEAPHLLLSRTKA